MTKVTRRGMSAGEQSPLSDRFLMTNPNPITERSVASKAGPETAVPGCKRHGAIEWRQRCARKPGTQRLAQHASHGNEQHRGPVRRHAERVARSSSIQFIAVSSGNDDPCRGVSPSQLRQCQSLPSQLYTTPQSRER